MMIEDFRNSWAMIEGGGGGGGVGDKVSDMFQPLRLKPPLGLMWHIVIFCLSLYILFSFYIYFSLSLS